MIDLGAFEERIRRAGILALFLDFDGTLARLALRPEHARLEAAMEASLRRLIGARATRVAVISGRALGDLKGKIALEGLYLAGNHGMEVEGPGFQFTHHPSAEERPRVAAVSGRLRASFGESPGVLIEEKGLTVAVHFRLVPLSDRRAVREAVRRIAAAQPEPWRIMEGNSVIELLPAVGWTKGSCADLLLAHYARESPRPRVIFPIAIGDDRTDRDLFAAMSGRGVSVAVGALEDLRADHRLGDVEDVRRFLDAIEQWRTDGSPGMEH